MADDIVGRIDEKVLQSTVKLTTSANTFGTGFIVSVPADNNNRYFFLVTNKHMVGKYSLSEGTIKDFYDYIIVDLYNKDNKILHVKVPIKNKEGMLNNKRVFLHPGSYIDIVVLPIADALNFIEQDNKVSLDISMLPSSATLKKWHVDIGDQVFALGYPYHIYSQSNNYPIAKSGFISSKIGEELTVKVPYRDEKGNNSSIDLKGKLIVLDGVFVPGNSGGPIVIPRGKKEITDTKTNNILQGSKSIPNFVIGIQSQSITNAGISFAFSSEYIIDLVNEAIKEIKEIQAAREKASNTVSEQK